MHILLSDIFYDVYLLIFGKAWGNLVFTRGGGGGAGGGGGREMMIVNKMLIGPWRLAQDLKDR